MADDEHGRQRSRNTVSSVPLQPHVHPPRARTRRLARSACARRAGSSIDISSGSVSFSFSPWKYARVTSPRIRPRDRMQMRDMRRLLRIAAARHRPRLHRGEAEHARAVGVAAAEARETVRCRRIGLPDLHAGIRARLAVAIQHRAGQRDLLALRAEPRQVGPGRVLEQVPVRADRSGWRWRSAWLSPPSAWRRARAARHRSGSPARSPAR